MYMQLSNPIKILLTVPLSELTKMNFFCNFANISVSLFDIQNCELCVFHMVHTVIQDITFTGKMGTFLRANVHNLV